MTAVWDDRHPADVLPGPEAARTPAHQLVLGVVDELEPHLQHFVAHACVLAVLDPHACDELLDRTDSGEVLSELERRGLAAPEVARGSDRGYRLPVLVREALAAELAARLGPGAMRAAYRRAGQIHERAGAWWEAVWAFSRAGDAEAVERLSRSKPDLLPKQADAADVVDLTDAGAAAADTAGARTAGPSRSAAAWGPRPGPALGVRLLGTFEISRDGVPIDLAPLRPRVRSVLQYLALLADTHVHRDVLAAVLWPDSDLETGRRGVQVAVSALRSLLQPGLPRQSTLLPRRGDAYALALAGHGSSDVVDLDTQLTRARRARAVGDVASAITAWRQVARLYRGELLLEQGNAEWVVAERDRLRLATADALESLGRHLAGTDAAGDGIDALRRALELEPFRDGTWRTLAETHEALGDLSAAAAVRQRHRRVLVDLGVLDDGDAAGRETGRGPRDRNYGRAR